MDEDSTASSTFGWLLMWAWGLLLSTCAEADWLLKADANRRSGYLRKGFSGRLLDAGCSSSSDKESIHKEIFESGKLHEVEAAVRVGASESHPCVILKGHPGITLLACPIWHPCFDPGVVAHEHCDRGAPAHCSQNWAAGRCLALQSSMGYCWPLRLGRVTSSIVSASRAPEAGDARGYAFAGMLVDSGLHVCVSRQEEVCCSQPSALVAGRSGLSTDILHFYVDGNPVRNRNDPVSPP